MGGAGGTDRVRALDARQFRIQWHSRYLAGKNNGHVALKSAACFASRFACLKRLDSSVTAVADAVEQRVAAYLAAASHAPRWLAAEG